MTFVTGGTGLVGAHLLFELTSKGEYVKALKRRTSNLGQVLKIFSFYSENPEKLFSQIEWVDGDILDYFGLENILAGVTEIYHCAAIVSFDPEERKKMIANNVEGTANIVNAAIENGVKKICHVSSIAALGRLENGKLITEETSWIPSKKISGYSESKFFSETEIWRGIEEGLDAIIVNPSIIFGPANWETGSAKMFKTIWDGLKFYTKGITGFVDVRDVVKAMVLLMEKSNFETAKNHRYLLNAENLSYQNIFFQIADALEKPRPKYFASDLLLNFVWRAAKFTGLMSGKRPAITRETVANSNAVYKFDGSKITKQFNFEYHQVSETIQQTAAFLKREIHDKKF
ncbi:MAG TPA: NAD-dependent epimerase/dehydratase family protein [Draconibacterium sp.]|nr:NAD-dependent epimerase/dehydratase family protein [Draconibacterium sp.]